MSATGALSSPLDPGRGRALVRVKYRVPVTKTEAILGAAVEAIGGAPRDGQRAMAEAISTAFERGDHLLVQAGDQLIKLLTVLLQPGIARLLSA